MAVAAAVPTRRSSRTFRILDFFFFFYCGEEKDDRRDDCIHMRQDTNGRRPQASPGLASQEREDLRRGEVQVDLGHCTGLIKVDCIELQPQLQEQLQRLQVGYQVDQLGLLQLV